MRPRAVERGGAFSGLQPPGGDLMARSLHKRDHPGSSSARHSGRSCRKPIRLCSSPGR